MPRPQHTKFTQHRPIRPTISFLRKHLLVRNRSFAIQRTRTTHPREGPEGVPWRRSPKNAVCTELLNHTKTHPPSLSSGNPGSDTGPIPTPATSSQQDPHSHGDDTRPPLRLPLFTTPSAASPRAIGRNHLPQASIDPTGLELPVILSGS